MGIIVGDLGRGTLLSYLVLAEITLLILMKHCCNPAVTLCDQEQSFIQHEQKHQSKPLSNSYPRLRGKKEKDK